MSQHQNDINLRVYPTSELNTDVVQIWVARLAGTTEARSTAWNVLSEAEKERADRLRTSYLKSRFIYSHAWLRIILGHYTGIEPLDLQITETSTGKPILHEKGARPLHFNMTHSGELAVYAFCSDTEVGVDVEEMRTLKDLDAIARRFFTSSEAEWIRSHAAADQTSAFFQVWTRKEAYVKALGRGVSHGLGKFSVLSKASNSVVVEEQGAAQPMTVRDLDMPDGYVGAVACEGLAWKLEVTQLPSTFDIRS